MKKILLITAATIGMTAASCCGGSKCGDKATAACATETRCDGAACCNATAEERAGVVKATAACATETRCDGIACCNATVEERAGVVKAIEYYMEGGKKGDSRIMRKGFARDATMSWRQNGTLRCVPVQVLYDIVDQAGPADGSYELTALDVAEDAAIVRIESRLGEAEYADMFTLVKDGDDWKIVSKVYHTK